MTYLDKVEFKVRDTSRNFLTISNWTVEGVRKRVNEELKEGGFGREKIMERLDMVPVYAPLEEETAEKINQEEKEKEDVHEE